MKHGYGFKNFAKVPVLGTAEVWVRRGYVPTRFSGKKKKIGYGEVDCGYAAKLKWCRFEFFLKKNWSKAKERQTNCNLHFLF